MIPQSFKDIVSNADGVGFYQTVALIIFMIFFVGVVVYVFSRPKKYYSEQENAPLDDDSTFNNKK